MSNRRDMEVDDAACIVLTLAELAVARMSEDETHPDHLEAIHKLTYWLADEHIGVDDVGLTLEQIDGEDAV